MRVRSWRLATRPSVTRIPFRYGKACLTDCPQAMLEMTVDFNGTLVRGYAADCLPPLWFDKSPDCEFTQQIDDMIDVISQSAKITVEAGKMDSLSTLVSVLWETVHAHGRPPLLENFGHSMVERCTIDARLMQAGSECRSGFAVRVSSAFRAKLEHKA